MGLDFVLTKMHAGNDNSPDGRTTEYDRKTTEKNGVESNEVFFLIFLCKPHNSMSTCPWDAPTLLIFWAEIQLESGDVGEVGRRFISRKR